MRRGNINIFPCTLNSSRRWNEINGFYISGETAPGTHCIGGWVGATAGLDAAER
jgi:hypothetical protein